MEAQKLLLRPSKTATGSATAQLAKFMPGVGFEPTRTKRPADLKSAPLDHSGIQATQILRATVGEPMATSRASQK